LYSFVFGGTDGDFPNGSLVFDSAGNLYGTTVAGGKYGRGTVFELSPVAEGPWTETILYNFGEAPGDGRGPAEGVVFDQAGNLYGTTYAGGITGGTCPSYGCGTVFELSMSGSQWSETILHSFAGGTDGEDPESAVTLDAAGDLYGTTLGGGGQGCVLDSDVGCGTVFEVSQSAGVWTETILHAFQEQGSGGAKPWGVILDAEGNLYGVTEYGGRGGWGALCGNSQPLGCGAVYELSPSQSGWTENVIHLFRGNGNGFHDGFDSRASLVFDASGRLYGTTYQGGSQQSLNGWGTAFRLTRQPDGHWTEERFNFTSQNGGAFFPANPVVLDKAGNVYGGSMGGPIGNANGVVYKIVLSP
jgi:uncharacterized repeat protein (TIGR03803 family)